MRHLQSLLFALTLLAGCAGASTAEDGAQDEGASGSAGDGGSASTGSGGTKSGEGGQGAGASSGGSSDGGSNSGGSNGQGAGSQGSGGSGPAPSGLPCEISQLLQQYCWSCHGSAPSGGAPIPLITPQDLLAPSKNDPTKSYAQRSLARMKGTDGMMPPSPASPVPASGVALFESWVNAGAPATGCNPGGTGGAAGSGGSGGQAPGGSGGATGGGGSPYDTPVMCTSKTMWTNGDSGSPEMHPGLACMSCHKLLGKATGKVFDVAGTVYPSAHEPDNCNGVGNGATVVITDATGQEHVLQVNSAGNFYHNNLFGFASFALPIKAKVVYNGKERVMATPQMSGDCNSCHTEKGDSNAPGRIMLPLASIERAARTTSGSCSSWVTCTARPATRGDARPRAPLPKAGGPLPTGNAHTRTKPHTRGPRARCVDSLGVATLHGCARTPSDGGPPPSS